MDETAGGVNAKLEIWREALESKGFRISMNKTEYMHCEFNDYRSAQAEVVRIQGHEVPKS